MIVRLPIGGFILPQPALGFIGRPPASIVALESSTTDVSAALASIGAAEPPVPPVLSLEPALPPEPLVTLEVPPLPGVIFPPVPFVEPAVPDDVAGESESEHPTAAAIEMKRIETRALRMMTPMPFLSR
jgi:hypothetical protein